MPQSVLRASSFGKPPVDKNLRSSFSSEVSDDPSFVSHERSEDGSRRDSDENEDEDRGSSRRRGSDLDAVDEDEEEDEPLYEEESSQRHSSPSSGPNKMHQVLTKGGEKDDNEIYQVLTKDPDDDGEPNERQNSWPNEQHSRPRTRIKMVRRRHSSDNWEHDSDSEDDEDDRSREHQEEDLDRSISSCNDLLGGYGGGGSGGSRGRGMGRNGGQGTGRSSSCDAIRSVMGNNGGSVSHNIPMVLMNFRSLCARQKACFFSLGWGKGKKT